MIRILDKNVSDKIAAGEVVESPLSVVKELVENSIDAGAKSIAVQIKGNGSDYIRVSDDGCGIAGDEVETAFKRHATSKLEKFSDLNNLHTLGFRGEALGRYSSRRRYRNYSTGFIFQHTCKEERPVIQTCEEK